MVKPGPKPTPFWDRIKEDGDCWLWTGYVRQNGYGYLRVNGRAWAAHRFAYYLVNDDLTPGLEIDHLCMNKLCINPDHLEQVTKQENCRRAVEAGRYAKPREVQCRRGHPFSGPNLTVSPNGKRRCKACQRIAQAAYRTRAA